MGMALAVIAAGATACGGNDDGVSGAAEAARVVSMAPAPGVDFVAADQAFVVEFTQGMDPASVETNYAVMMGSRSVAGRFHWTDDNRSMSFEPDTDLPTGAELQVRMGAGMRDAGGARVQDAEGRPMTVFEFTCMVYEAPTTFESAGEQIYFTATSPSGEPITFTMGDGFDDATMPGYGGMGSGDMGMMGGGMEANRQYGMACVSCHGPLGEGGRLLAMGTVRTPNIQYAVLTGEVEESATEVETHTHVPYDGATIAAAIVDGVEPNGEELGEFMPRWRLAPVDLQALVAFVKTL